MPDSVVVVIAIVLRHPRAILVAMITMGKSTHGFALLSYMAMGLLPFGSSGRWSSAIKIPKIFLGILAILGRNFYVNLQFIRRLENPKR